MSIDETDWKKVKLDLAFCALPHATTQKVIADLLDKSPKTKVVDLSADFRLSDTAAYAKWYGHEHHAPKLQREAGVSFAGMSTYLTPLWAALLGWLFVGEGLEAYHFVGAALVLPGIALAGRRPSWRNG